jgi:hypothetical protein
MSISLVERPMTKRDTLLVHLDPMTGYAVRRLAAANDRTISAELRQAIRAHLTTTQKGNA